LANTLIFHVRIIIFNYYDTLYNVVRQCNFRAEHDTAGFVPMQFSQACPMIT